jgi:hypothetical protein
MPQDAKSHRLASPAFFTDLFRVVTAAVVLALTPQLAAQEVQSAAGTARDAGQDASTIAPPAWHGTVTVGLTLQSGLADQVGIDVGGAVLRHAPPWSTLFEASYTYATVNAGGIDQTVADVQNHRLLLRRDLTPRTFLLFRPSYTRNTVLRVDYRIEELVGFGFRVAHRAGLTLNLVPVIGAVQQHKHLPAVDGGTGTAGLFESVEYRINPAWSLQQLLLYLQDFTDSEDRRIQMLAALTGAIRGPVGLRLSYTLDRENVVLALKGQTEQRVVAGVTVKF